MRLPAARLALFSLAAPAFWAAGCGGAPAAVQPPAPGPRAATENANAECAEIAARLDEAVRAAPPGELRFATRPERLLELAAELERTGDALEQLRDRLPQELALPLHRFLRAIRVMNIEVANVAVSKTRAATARSSGPAAWLPAHADRVFGLSHRWRELERRSTMAQCSDDGSRDQTTAWQASVVERVLELREPLRACYDAARAQFPTESVDSLEIKIHIDAEGRVELAGPTTMHPLAQLSSEVAHCLVEQLERAVFPAPVGRAIIVVPFEPPQGS
jgi:hypothetical protein